MKMRSMLSIALVSSFLSSSVVLAGAREAGNIGNAASRAKALVSRILASRQGGGGQVTPGFPQPGFPNPGFPRPGNGGGGRFPWQNENDVLAAPIWLQSAGSLDQASNAAFESQAAFLSGNIQFAIFKFTTACSRLAMSKSALARANLASIQPPAGFYAPFSGEVFAMLNELESQRTSNGCL